jgi:hypothetical protein
VIDPSCGRIFSWADPLGLVTALNEMTEDRYKLSKMGRQATTRASLFDIARTEDALIAWLMRDRVQ